MKRALALLAFALLPLADRSARADSVTPAPATLPIAKASPALSSLPEGRLGELKVPAVPERIPAKEKAEGFHAAYPTVPHGVVPAPARRRGAPPATAPTVILVSSSAEQIRRIYGGSDEPRDQIQTEPLPCFAVTYEPREKPDTIAKWMGSFAPVANLPAWSFAHESFGRARLVRSERFLPGKDGQATLEVAHAWVDTETLGMRLVDRARIALRQVQSGPGGLDVYAAHDGRQVLFVLRPPIPDAGQGLGMSLMFTSSDGDNGSSQCGHLAIRLQAEHVGDAQLSTVTGELAGTRELGNAPPEFGREFKVRPFRLTLSESWMSRDPEPVLATSFGWSGRVRSEIR